MAVLTDGQQWHFYLPGEPGNFHERQICLLDIVESKLSESSKCLQRYLDYQAARSGAALEAARADYQDVARGRLAKATIPRAWAKLVEEQDDILIDLISEKVQNICEYKPSAEAVIAFLIQQLLPGTPRNAAQVLPMSKGPQIAKANKPLPGMKAMDSLHAQPLAGRPQTKFGFSLHGQEYPAKAANDVMVKIFRCFAQRDGSFPERFAVLHRGKKKRCIAKRREDLNPARPDLVEKYSRQFAPGWWIDVNLDRKKIVDRIQWACDVAGIRYGIELKVHLPPSLRRVSN